MRELYRQEMNCQVVYDSIHRRPGLATIYALQLDDTIAGFGSMAMGGPWEGKPTIFEFYVLPEHSGHAFHLFDALRDATGARLMQVQSNDALLAAMLYAYGREISPLGMVFRDGVTTALPANGAVLEQTTPDADIRAAIEERQGGGEWRLRLDGETVGTGGILFHYNVPYGDIYMEVAEPFRRRGFGAYLVQELKRLTYELGSVPAARCGHDNVPSRMTLQKAGLVPYAHLLKGSIATT